MNTVSCSSRIFLLPVEMGEPRHLNGNQDESRRDLHIISRRHAGSATAFRDAQCSSWKDAQEYAIAYVTEAILPRVKFQTMYSDGPCMFRRVGLEVDNQEYQNVYFKVKSQIFGSQNP